MALEEATDAILGVDLGDSSEGSAPCTYALTVGFEDRLRGKELHTSILLEVWVGGLEEDLDSVQRRDDSLGLREREGYGACRKTRDKKGTYDATSDTSSDA